MGCDIHMAIEVRSVSSYRRKDRDVQRIRREVAKGTLDACSVLEDVSVREGTWELAAAPFYHDECGGRIPGWHVVKWPAPWSDPAKPDPYMCSFQSSLPEPPMPYWDDRSYEAFAILAGVRNYHDATPIAEPRDWPDDVSEQAKEIRRDCTLGDHSFSWLLASEILNAPQFRQKVARGGLVAAKDFREWKASGEENPASWCGGASPSTIITEEAALAGSDGYWEYVECNWMSSREFEVVTMAQAWADRFGAGAVRFVFGFDS